MGQYKSARGQLVDFDALAAKHENVRAVGNIDVNARGDIIDKDNKVVKSVNQRVAEVNRNVEKAKPLASELSAAEQEFDDNDDEIIKGKE